MPVSCQKEQILLTVRQDPSFAPFLKKTYNGKIIIIRLRGPESSGSKSAEGRADLEAMLGCIVNFCTVIASYTITNDCKCLDDIGRIFVYINKVFILVVLILLIW